MSTLEDVYNALQNDPLFQQKFQKNPIEALEEFKFELSDAEIKKIVLASKSHQETIDLERRTSE